MTINCSRFPTFGPLVRLQWPGTLFSQAPKPLSLLRLAPVFPEPASIRHSFEKALDLIRSNRHW